MKLSDKSRQILELISDGHSYEQILSMHSDYTYNDIFASAEEALELGGAAKSSYEDRMQIVKKKHANAHKPWTDEHEELLKKMY